MPKSVAMQVLLQSKTRKMQRHPRQSGHRKTKAVAGSQKGKKVENKKAKEINQKTSLHSSPNEPTRTHKTPFPPFKNNVKEEPKQLVLHPRIITLGNSEDSEPSLDYSTPSIPPTSANVEAPQKCMGNIDNLEPPSLPSISCEATDQSCQGSTSKKASSGSASSAQCAHCKVEIPPGC